MSLRHAALTEPAARRPCDRSRHARARAAAAEARTLVIGGGAVGLLAALLLKSYGVVT